MSEEKSLRAENSSRDPATARKDELMRFYPTAYDLRRRAQQRLPNFAFEYCDGGAGADGCIKRNWNAFDSVELMPRYGKVITPPSAKSTIFGRGYSAPIGISPIGGPGTVYPGAERHFAAAAQAAKVPYTLGVVSGLSVEEAATIAPDVLWFQLYRFAKNEHRIGLDLVRRASIAGVHALVLTFDTPTRTTRPRETKAGIPRPFRMSMQLRMDALSSPHWTKALAKTGLPKWASLKEYMGERSLEESEKWMRQEQGGAFTWDEIARYRDAWKKPLVVKGILHPEDAEKAVKIGVDGIQISNHGGRQIEALPATVDVLPAIARQVNGRATIIIDSGVRSGVDAARAIALGADAAFAGKAFLWSLGALGPEGPGHLINVLTEDVRATLGQLGCLSVGELRGVPVRHPGAYQIADCAHRAPIAETAKAAE